MVRGDACDRAWSVTLRRDSRSHEGRKSTDLWQNSTKKEMFLNPKYKTSLLNVSTCLKGLVTVVAVKSINQQSPSTNDLGSSTDMG